MSNFNNPRFRFVLAALTIFLVLILALFSRYQRHSKTNSSIITPETEMAVTQKQSKSGTVSSFVPTLERSGDRVTKKPFGLYVSPESSPVSPERFQGYHTATDFEIFEEEVNLNVPVKTVCSGKLLQKDVAAGYGGFVVQSCSIENEPITVVYGHIKPFSVKKKVGDPLVAGEILGLLGDAYSFETDGERKHLHLGFHKGVSPNVRGYLSRRGDLSEWLDPCKYVCPN